MDNKEKYTYLRAASHLTRFGLDMISPMVLCVAAAVWLRNEFDMGGWVVICAIVLGVVCAAANMFRYINTVRKETGGKHDATKCEK